MEVVHPLLFLFPFLLLSEYLLALNDVYLEFVLRSLYVSTQTYPTDAEMAEADRNCKDKEMKKKRLPSGISEYQVGPCV